MNKLSPTEKKLAVANVLLIGGAAVFFVVWISVIEPAIQTFIEVAIGKKIYELPDIMRWVYMSVFGLLPPFAIGGAAYAYSYYKLYLPIRAKLAADQLQKLAEARRAMMSAVDLMESFEQELRAKSSKVEKELMFLTSITVQIEEATELNSAGLPYSAVR